MFLLPKSNRNYSRFLYYFCLCKSFKELFPILLVRRCSWFAGAKVRLFSEPPKLFQEKITFFMHFLCALDLCQYAKRPSPYYIIYKESWFCKEPGTTDWTDETDFSTTDYGETLIFLKDNGLNGWNGFSTTDCTDDTGYNRINMQEISSNKNKF